MVILKGKGRGVYLKFLQQNRRCMGLLSGL